MSDDWKEDSSIHSVIDEDGKQMWFRLNPARESPESAPIFLILHGHGTTSRPTFYSEPKWNIIAPIDNFGLDNKGSWWIGVDGDKSTSNLLSLVVTKSKDLLKSKKDVSVCIYGSSMGGYGAILNADRLNADAVYANVPQIRLLGSTYSELGMKKYFHAALGKEPDDMYNDLNNYIRTVKRKYPLFFICENRFGQRDYLQQQTMSFVGTLEELQINFHLEIVPTSGHNKNLGLREVRSLFEKYLPQLNHLIEQ
jgi:hypothetical protein